MAKSKSTEIVSEEDEAIRKFDTMSEKVDKIFEKLFPPTESNPPKPKESNVAPIETAKPVDGPVTILRKLGILSEE